MCPAVSTAPAGEPVRTDGSVTHLPAQRSVFWPEPVDDREVTADCILHVEHHQMNDECVMAVITWAQGLTTTWEFGVWEQYQMHYEQLACRQLMEICR